MWLIFFIKKLFANQKFDTFCLLQLIQIYSNEKKMMTKNIASLKNLAFLQKKHDSDKPREIVYVNRKKQANNWDLTSHSKQEIDI